MIRKTITRVKAVWTDFAPCRTGRADDNESITPMSWVNIHVVALLAVFWAGTAHAAPVSGGQPGFRSPTECVHRLKLPIKICAEYSQRAWQIYLTQAPRFSTRNDCWRSFKVCIVLPLQWIAVNGEKRTVANVIRYAPPLWMIRLDEARPGSPFTILIDSSMQPMRVLETPPILPPGRMQPSEARVRRSYEDALSVPQDAAARAADTPERLKSPLEGLRPELDTHPLPEAMRKRLRQ